MSTLGQTQKKAGREARRTPRRVYQRPIGVLCKGKYAVNPALQLSEGGLLFQSDVRFSSGDQVVVTLILPGGSSVVARGEVIYEKPAPGKAKQYGVKFVALALNIRRFIRNYVTAKTQAEAEAETEEGEESARRRH